MALVVDENDPCAAAASLLQVYYKLIAGQSAISVDFKAGASGVERSVSYHKADPARLVAVIRGFEEKCAQSAGQKPRRRAIATGGVR
jgi:hypothetical protein